ncbi:glycolate oxidase subunit GlcE [Janthinobacterium fluminis]|uniref:Glycolate oxidase subunit GlcE n=1 Tax=Janthinobacterium fluminis TaxID=2987524 RepID=A0ABT5K784_9BURK|nr:glycolate oxidase subunit GlcE [Janthinobacterium fluminis]MDC8760865.1 glycolate oxidase subunit GlcE [Janthinobacterium fluminis]
MDTILTQFRERIAEAAAGAGPLRLRGGGSKDWYGQAPRGAPLDTRAYAGITAYEPSELVITARCGTPLAELDAALAARGQMLACEPPHFGPAATVGGMLACGLSGPRRQAVGAVRDFVLGAVLMDGRGQTLRFGGQVMKNVAGYDVARLLAGSLGTLGLILEASLKVLPKPYREATVALDMEQAEALRRLNDWGGQPLPISASVWSGGRLHLRLSGARAAVQAARLALGGDAAAEADADALWLALREQRHAFFERDGGAALWRLGLPSAAPPLTLAGAQLIEWGGAQRWLKSAADAAAVRAAAAALGGHATLFRGGDKDVGVFQPLAPAVAAIHRNLKQAFDPAGIFNPGRMYTGL